MNYNTAVRMVKPGYCPARRRGIRIYNNKWYLCTFQDTSSDIGGGHYLEEGEHTLLLQGREARRARDSQLNHLNDIAKWDGSVFAVSNPQRNNLKTYHASRRHAEVEAEAIREDASTRMRAALVFTDKELAWTDEEMLAKYGLCKDWPGNEVAKITEHRAYLEGLKVANREYWQRVPEVGQIR